MKTRIGMILLVASSVLPCSVQATETENQGIQALPTPKAIEIDGATGDWDLSGGVFVCSDVESLRDKMGAWIHVMYDEEHLYILARWRDETPMGNPGSVSGSFGWLGDSLQARLVVGQTTGWLTAWRDRDGKDLVDLSFPHNNHKNQKDAKAAGAQQAFRVTADGKGYIQELAVPWNLLTPDPFEARPGASMKFSTELNFNIPGRITMKGIFAAGQAPDRVFTFSSVRSWGKAMLRAKGNVKPQALRLADNREFDVSMVDGVPTVNWSGLFEQNKREGFAKIKFVMPEDGFVSLNIKDADEQVVRQLLTANFMTQGEHEILWDGLTNTSYLKPGDIVAPGDYTWEGIYHKGLGLRLVGWAGTASDQAFGRGWGGDHGAPCAVTTNKTHVFLGWSGSEAGKALVCMDMNGKVRWTQKRGGFGGALHIAATQDRVYVNTGHVIYRVDTKQGGYRAWRGSDSAEVDMRGEVHGLDIVDGKLYVVMADGVRILDAETGAELKRVPVQKGGDLEASHDGKVYMLAGRSQLLQVTEQGAKVILEGLRGAKALAIDPEGNFLIGLADPDNRVVVYNPSGKELRRIGKKGGRPLLGPWEQDGMRFVHALRVDGKGRLWVAEKDYTPKRFSSWNADDGTFIDEFFGPTAYGALGGAISPIDPLVMVGSGSEWKIDKQTGRASVIGVFHRRGMGNARFGVSPDGRQFVAVAEGWIHKKSPVSIYERLGPGQYKFRTRITALEEGGARVWADANDDEQEQPEEVKEYKVDLGGWITGWSLTMTPSLVFYGGQYRVEPTGWTACGAPQYDMSSLTKLPAPSDISKRGGAGSQRGLGSDDGRLMVYNSHYGAAHSDFQCWDTETGKMIWSYPSNYVGVHGGHKAPPAQTGMIRAAYDVVGTGKLPEPIGDIFVIYTDKGEWHILTGEGYYLSHLFQTNPVRHQFPKTSEPGAILDNCPPGLGSEDFGGSIAVTEDGSLYVQAGKTSFVNAKVVGLETVKKLGQGKLKVSEGNLVQAQQIRGKLLQASVGKKQYSVKRKTVRFTGNLAKDFAGQETIKFQKSAADHTQGAIAYDDTHLYVGYRVNDATPWINGASDPAQMYAMGDTVDLQLGAMKPETLLGNLRLSVGRCGGKDVAVAYRTDATPDDVAPRKFYSGLVRDGYEMKSVKVIEDVKIHVKAEPGQRYAVVEVALPLKSIGLTLEPGLALQGDVGVTFGNAKGDDTVLRSYWNNQETGIVADEVYELQMTPTNWGRLVFE